MADGTKRQAAQNPAESGRGLGLLSLIVGLAAGGAVYWITDRWIDARTPSPASLTVLQTIVVFAAGWLLLSERRDFVRPVIPAAIIAAIVAAPTFTLSAAAANADGDLGLFPVFAWFAVSAPLATYLMTSLAKATLETGAPPKYASIFFHGLTLPLVAGGAAIFAGLSLVLLYAWAALLKQMDVVFFSELFDEPWFVFPFLGAIGGLSIAMIRGQQSVLGALRFMLLLFSRIAMPIMAAFSITFLIALAAKGPGAILSAEFLFARPAAALLFLAFSGMLIFNGVYQNAEGAPPALWLRLSTLIVIAIFPVYTGLCAYGIWTRIAEYALTPPRIAGAVMTLLAFGYSLVLIVGLIGEANWRARKWMPFVAPANAATAIVWIVVLIAASSPAFNMWAMSARSQERHLLSGRVDAAQFDYGYLRFELGEYGEAALKRLENAAHPQAEIIRREIARVRAAQTYWEYANPEFADPAARESAGINARENDEAEPEELQFNPEGAPPD